MDFLLIGVGLLLLLGGGEALVRGSVAAAARFGVSPLVIGLTLVGFGTSLPELVASLKAALAGSSGVAMGNVVGSNIANILLILGLAGLIFPIKVAMQGFRRDGAVLLFASLLMVAVALYGSLGRGVGAVFILLLAAYTLYSFLGERQSSSASQVPMPQIIPKDSLLFSLLLVCGGIAGVVFGAGLLVDSAIALARGWGVSESVIGLTLVAVGTSLPELVTSVMAAWRKQPDVALGNIIGSNIFNILGIAGVTALVVPLDVPQQIASRDIWVMLASALLLIALIVIQKRISRVGAGIMFAGYACYLALQVAFLFD